MQQSNTCSKSEVLGSLEVGNRTSRSLCQICSKLAIIAQEQCHCHCSGVVIINIEQISHMFHRDKWMTPVMLLTNHY